LTVSSAGRAVWVPWYRHGTRRFELTLGRYPNIGLADARVMATLERADILKGANPAPEKRKAKAVAAKDWTVRALIQDYREKKLNTLARSTQVCYGRHLKQIDRKLGPLGAVSCVATSLGRTMSCRHGRGAVPNATAATRTSTRTPFANRSTIGSSSTSRRCVDSRLTTCAAR
jgi:hypothetical protein